MGNDLIQTLIEHPRRRAIIWATAVVFGMLFIVPAWDRFSNARTELSEHQTELNEIAYSLSNLDVMQRRLEELRAQPNASKSAMDGESSEQIREAVTRLTQRMGCRIRRLTMSDATIRPWRKGDDPFSLDSNDDREETGFDLETRSLALSVGGTLPELTGLTIALNRLDRFAVPSNLTLQREGIDGHLILDVEISLFNLVETYD